MKEHPRQNTHGRDGRPQGARIWDGYVVIDTVEVIGAVRPAESIRDQDRAVYRSMVSVAALIVGTSVERVVSYESLIDSTSLSVCTIH